MKILRNFVVTRGLRREDGSQAQVGDSVRLYPYEGDPFIGVIQFPITEVNCGKDRSYVIQYDLDVIVRADDLEDRGDVLGCCDALDLRVSELETNAVGFTVDETTATFTRGEDEVVVPVLDEDGYWRVSGLILRKAILSNVPKEDELVCVEDTGCWAKGDGVSSVAELAWGGIHIINVTKAYVAANAEPDNTINVFSRSQHLKINITEDLESSCDGIFLTERPPGLVTVTTYGGTQATAVLVEFVGIGGLVLQNGDSHSGAFFGSSHHLAVSTGEVNAVYFSRIDSWKDNA